MPESLKSERTTVKRLPKRGVYDAETIHAILDEGFVCHVGFCIDGHPGVIPTAYVRDGSTLYLHGSVANRMLRVIAGGGEACVVVTHIDGLVLARSAFHHSMNYRSAVVIGAGRTVMGEERDRAMMLFTERMARGRSMEVRPPNEAELKQTLVVAIPIEEASAKVRTGPPLDDDEDYDLAVWAGVVPMKLQAGEPISDERLKDGVVLPSGVRAWVRG